MEIKFSQIIWKYMINKPENMTIVIFNDFWHFGNIWDEMIKKFMNKWIEKLTFLSVRALIKGINKLG